ncbi:hypothetical protein EDD18DRAFT_1115575 [Armillaria luteobubalina]|uniref:Uncharacterized protein n=1 Tax=Armillaria luteobubalina TaxID=153913 RepID=A0AA39U7P3_9AGAR|nr:hypothetical protein EDD18DRAFT_1115575 [Armillaria luteobubalina]
MARSNKSFLDLSVTIGWSGTLIMGRCFVSFVWHTKDNNADGLDKESPEGKHREGELLVEDITGGKHRFKIVVDHQYLIPEGLYTLVGSDMCDYEGTFEEEQCWVVGERLARGMFKKVLVFVMPNKDEVSRLYASGIATLAKTFLA